MKGIYLIAIATVFLTSWNVINAEEEEFNKSPTKCPAKDLENITIYLPHESDCTKYYICRAGEKILKRCPCINEKGDRLRFNPRIQACDWPFANKCTIKNSDQEEDVVLNLESIEEEEHHRPFLMDKKADSKHKESNKDQTLATNEKFIPKKEHNRVARTVNTNNECPDRNPGNGMILLPHEHNCTKFYICLQGRKVERNCPYMNDKGHDRLHFNRRIKHCDLPYKAGCDGISKRISYLDNEDRSREIPPECPDEDPTNTTIHLAHEYDCTKFYMCQGGRKILLECPNMNEHGDKLHFNPRLQVCDLQDQADRRSCGSTISAFSMWRLSLDDECRSGNDGLLLPHECNGNKFYYCVGGNRVLSTCRNGLYFNKKYQACLIFEKSDCKRRPLYKCTQEDEVISHECDCTKYYKCREEDWVLQECRNGRHFSPECQRCVDKNDDNCGLKPPHPRPGDCPKPAPEHPWRHECNCRLYYTCENGKKRLQECLWEYYFDVKRNRCSHQRYVTDCKNHWDD